VTDLKWKDNQHNSILCQVKFAEFNEVLPFLAMPTDVEEHGRFIFNQAVDGVYGEIADNVYSEIANNVT
jgi:hypothetical protein